MFFSAIRGAPTGHGPARQGKRRSQNITDLANLTRVPLTGASKPSSKTPAGSRALRCPETSSSSESSAPSMATRRDARVIDLIRDNVACAPQVPARRDLGPGHRLERRPPGEGGGGDQEAREVNRRKGASRYDVHIRGGRGDHGKADVVREVA